jgi:hypothetical protein
MLVINANSEYSQAIQKIEIPNKTNRGNIQIAPRYMYVEIGYEADMLHFWESG